MCQCAYYMLHSMISTASGIQSWSVSNEWSLIWLGTAMNPCLTNMSKHMKLHKSDFSTFSCFTQPLILLDCCVYMTAAATHPRMITETKRVVRGEVDRQRETKTVLKIIDCGKEERWWKTCTVLKRRAAAAWQRCRESKSSWEFKLIIAAHKGYVYLFQ